LPLSILAWAARFDVASAVLMLRLVITIWKIGIMAETNLDFGIPTLL